MEKVSQPSGAVFNGSIETGVRSLLLLEAFYPSRLDLEALSLLDYFVVHTEDLGGPASLHPALPERMGEYRVRRTLIQEALQMLRRISLVDVIEGDDGISFVSGDDAPALVKLLSSEYNQELLSRAKWLASRAGEEGVELFASMRLVIDRWTLEFQTEQGARHG